MPIFAQIEYALSCSPLARLTPGVRTPRRAARQLQFLLSILGLAIIPWTNPLCAAKPFEAVQGRLLSAAGSSPKLRTGTKEILLASKNTSLLHTLQDKRLRDREVRIEGTSRPDGSFEVERFYTVHDGKLYRVRYYCEICNIEALEPGDCVCCQKPTELQELPVAGAVR